MSRIIVAALLLSITLCSVVVAQDFIYSYREASREPGPWRVCLGSFKDGKIENTEIATAPNLKMHYLFSGCSSGNVFLTRYGEQGLDWLNLKTHKINPLARDFRRIVCSSATELVYIGIAESDDAPDGAGVLKRYLFAEGRSEVLMPEFIIQQIPFPAGRDISKPLDVLWGVFWADGKRVLGKVEMKDRKLRVIAPLEEEILCADVSPDGSRILIGSRDINTTGVESENALSARLDLVEVAAAKVTALARTLHQQVPVNPGIRPNFSAVFAGDGHVLYPETVQDGGGGISHQRLIDRDLASGKNKEIASITDKNRVINAAPMHTGEGWIMWGEYKIDPQTREVKLQRGPDSVYRIENRADLIVGSKKIAQIEMGQVWEKNGLVAFIGRLDPADKPALYVYRSGMEKPVQVSPEQTVIRTFGFVE